MDIIQVRCLALVTLLMFLLIHIGGDSTPNALPQNATGVSSQFSPWLKKVAKQRPFGCRGRPWVCSQGEFPPRTLCCRNRCVNVTSDKNNCGLCGIRCPFNWQCCRGLCRDTNFSIFNCGKCGNRCPFGQFCFFGMCGYAQEYSSFVSPRPSKQEPPKPLQTPHIQSHHPPISHQPPPKAVNEEF